MNELLSIANWAICLPFLYWGALSRIQAADRRLRLPLLVKGGAKTEPLLKKGWGRLPWGRTGCQRTKTYSQQHQGYRRICIVCIDRHGDAAADRAWWQKQQILKKDPLSADGFPKVPFGGYGDVLRSKKHLFTFASAPGFFHNSIYSWAASG